MQIDGAVAVVTGANRGLGREFSRQLLERGARVYGAARNPAAVDLPGVEALELDITRPEQAAAAARAAADANLLINNAGVSLHQNLVTGDLDQIRLEMETNHFGTLNVVRAFAPVLAANGGGAIANVLSASSWLAFPGHTSYSAAKAAEWMLTDGIRVDLEGQSTQVTGVHAGLIDTDMADWSDLPKSDPVEVIRAVLDGIEAGEDEVVADQPARDIKASLNASPEERYALPGANVLD